MPMRISFPIKQKLKIDKRDCNHAIKIIAVLASSSLLFMLLREGERLFSSDSLASDIIVQELSSSGSLSIHNYVSQQTFWIFNLPFWFPKYFLSMLVHNTILVDKITILMLYVLLLGLAFLVADDYCGNRKVAWLMLCILGSGISTAYIKWGIIESAYTIHIIYMLAFLILGASLIDKITAKSKRTMLNVILIMLFTVYILSFDQRYAAVFIVPFCAALLITTYLDCYKVDSLKKIERRLVLRVCLAELAIGCATAVGLLINGNIKNLLPFTARLTDISSYYFIEFDYIFDALAKYFRGILELWGADFSISVSTISIHFVIYLLKSCVCVLVMAVIPSKCIFQYKFLPAKLRFLLMFYWVMSLELFCIYALSNYNLINNNCRYYIYEIPIAVIISSWYLWEHMVKPHNLNRYLLILCVVVFCVISQISIESLIKNHEKEYEAKEEIIAALKEHNLTYGYATYWNAQIMTSISNAEIKVLPVNLDGALTPFLCLNYIHQFDTSWYIGETFLLLSTEEYCTMETDFPRFYEEIGEPNDMVSIGDYVALLYDHNITENQKYFPYNSHYVPLEGSYFVKEVVLEESNVEIEETDSVIHVAFPANIITDSYYKLEFTAQANKGTIDWCQVNFANEGYDYTDTIRIVSHSADETKYDIIIFSGEHEEVNEVILQIVSANTAPIKISQFRLSLLEVY